MLKNKILIIMLFLALCVPVIAEEPVNSSIPAVTQETQEETFEQIKANSNVVQEQAEQEKIDYKQPLSKRKIAKKFLLAMLGVAVSSVLLYLILSLYNKIRDGFTNPRTETPPNGETSLVTPDNLIDAVKTFLDKTKWNN